MLQINAREAIMKRRECNEHFLITWLGNGSVFVEKIFDGGIVC